MFVIVAAGAAAAAGAAGADGNTAAGNAGVPILGNVADLLNASAVIDAAATPQGTPQAAASAQGFDMLFNAFDQFVSGAAAGAVAGPGVGGAAGGGGAGLAAAGARGGGGAGGTPAGGAGAAGPAEEAESTQDLIAASKSMCQRLIVRGSNASNIPRSPNLQQSSAPTPDDIVFSFACAL